VVELFLRRSSTLQVGRKGCHRFPRGWYLYVGRARRGLGGRLKRHLFPGPRRRHWHIDTLTSSLHVRASRALVLPLEGVTECGIMQGILGVRGAVVPVPGFGSSDCRSPCPSHLAFFRERRAVHAAVRLLKRRFPGTTLFVFSSDADLSS